MLLFYLYYYSFRFIRFLLYFYRETIRFSGLIRFLGFTLKAISCTLNQGLQNQDAADSEEHALGL